VGVHDTWFKIQKGPNGTRGKRVKAAKYGRGKRWRVTYTDAAGEAKERLFEREADAKDFDAACRTGAAPEVRRRRCGAGGAAPEVRLDHAERNVSFPAYADRWREARNITWGLETRQRVERDIRLHLKPAFPGVARSITQTDVLLWLSRCLADGRPTSSLRLYFELLDAILAAAVRDKAIDDNPCDGIKLSQVFRGLTRAPKWVPSDQDVMRLFEVVPERYHGLLLLGAGEALRIGEALGVEDGPRCLEPEHGELHVVQQLGYEPREYDGGFHLRLPKGVRSYDPAASTVDLDPMVAAGLAWHRREYPPVEVEMLDLTSGRPVRRKVPLLFTTTFGNPFTDRTWSGEWGVGALAPVGRLAGGPEAQRLSRATALLRNQADRGARRPEGRATGAPARLAVDHPGDLRPLLAAGRTSPRDRRRGAETGRCGPLVTVPTGPEPGPDDLGVTFGLLRGHIWWSPGDLNP
jgi:hypothetical protein